MRRNMQGREGKRQMEEKHEVEAGVTQGRCNTTVCDEGQTIDVEAEPVVAQAMVCGDGDRCCDKSEESGEAIANTGDLKTKHEAEAFLGKLTGSGRNWRWSRFVQPVALEQVRSAGGV